MIVTIVRWALSELSLNQKALVPAGSTSQNFVKGYGAPSRQWDGLVRTLQDDGVLGVKEGFPLVAGSFVTYASFQITSAAQWSMVDIDRLFFDVWKLDGR